MCFCGYSHACCCVPLISCCFFCFHWYYTDDDEFTVSCGSVIKIHNADTGYYLHSEEKTLGGIGSGQQIVTFHKDKGTQDALWLVRPANHGNDESFEYPPEGTCQLAKPIRCNTAIRLTHLGTQRNLHSHGVQRWVQQKQKEQSDSFDFFRLSPNETQRVIQSA